MKTATDNSDRFATQDLTYADDGSIALNSKTGAHLGQTVGNSPGTHWFTLFAGAAVLCRATVIFLQNLPAL
jgi:hypothetical protein